MVETNDKQVKNKMNSRMEQPSSVFSENLILIIS